MADSNNNNNSTPSFSPFPMDIVRPKIDSPERIIQLAGVNPTLYTTAHEFNILLSAIDYLYNKITGPQNVNRYISGQVVWTGVDFIYKAVNLICELNAQIVTLNDETITLDAADPNYGRIDIIVVDNNGLNKITGIPSQNPAEPEYNPLTQVKIKFVYVPAAATNPSINIIDVYKENLQEAGGEWNTQQTAGNRITLENTANPIFGTKDIKTLNPSVGDKIIFSTDTPVALDVFNRIKFNFKSLHYWNQDSLKITLKNNDTTIAWDTITSRTFDTSSKNTQEVYAFLNGTNTLTLETEFNKIEVEIISEKKDISDPIDISFQVDNISIQTGDTQESGSIENIGISNLKPELKATVNVKLNTSPVKIDWSLGVSFYVPELTEDTTFTFTNVIENKIIDMIIKGEHAVTLPANVNTDDVDLDGTKWCVIQIKAYNVGGVTKIKASSFNLE